MYRRVIKRVLDLTASLIMLVCLFPLMVLVGCSVWWWLGSPVLFRQQRSGKDGRSFWVFKFRTMSNARDARGNLLPDGERLPRFSRLLRMLSLDELPQLWNVVVGDMSLVGPRPLLIQYVDRYSAHQRRRLEVVPGITGAAQVHGRNLLSWDERFDWDVWYVDNLNLYLDVKILVRTIGRILRPQGVSGEGQATMTEFMGSKRCGNKKSDVPTKTKSE